MKGTLALTLINLRLALRDRAVLFFLYIFPLLFFFIFQSALGGGRGPVAASTVLAMILVLGTMGNGLFGAGMRAVEDRDKGILRRLKLAPITPAPVLIASLTVGYLLYLPLVFLLFVLSHRLYGMPVPHNGGSLFVFISIGLLTFRALGLIVASVVNSPQESQIIIQLLYLPMLFLSGVTIPLHMLPKWAQAVSQFMPASYLLVGFKGMLVEGKPLLSHLQSIAALLVAFGICFFIAFKLFRWEKEEHIATPAKLWVLAALLPFLLLGIWKNLS